VFGPMDAGWLAEQLEAGRSIESIAVETGRSPSTVAYWVHKHGLQSQHAARHASKGGIGREVLETLVASGFSEREIASELGVSQATVRHWLLKHGLVTERAKRRRAIESQLSENGDGDATAVCPRHGSTLFRRRAEGGWRCLKCRAEAVVARRRAIKAALVKEAGGACVLCGYARSTAALHFHHLDPGAKEFHLSRHGVTRSIATARAEAAKCILLCANCHAEVEAGVATIPEAARPISPG
jgi:transcriptional regulator with XRE-family HTH domain